MSGRGGQMGWGRVSAAAFGAPGVAFLVGAFVASFAPGSDAAAFAMGWHLIIPLWVALVCTLPLFQSARSAWTLCGVVALLSGGALLLRGAW